MIKTKQIVLNKNAKTTSLVVLLVLAFLVSGFAGVQFVGPASAAGYTEVVGNLGDVNYVVRFPDPWNGMLVILCQSAGSSPALDARTTFYNNTASLLLAKGYAVAASNYGGASGFPVSKALNSTYTVTKYIVDTYRITGKVFLYGSVMGGNFALLLGEKYPNLYSGVLDVGGNLDAKETYKYFAFLANSTIPEIRSYLNLPPIYPDTMLQFLKDFGIGGAAANVVETGGTPTTNPKAYEDVSPTYHANITIPVITIHSTGDLLAPFSQVALYQAAVAKAGRSSLYRVYNTPPVVPGVGSSDANVQAQVPSRFDELVRWSNTLNNSFSIMQISDFQHLAFLNPTLYNDTTSWIVNNSASYNLQMVVYTGDFIDAFVTYPPPPPVILYNASQMAQEWVVANAAMSKLLNANIPYTWGAGNHDQTPFANASGTMTGSNYPAFNATTMRSKPYWVSDIYDSKNTAVKFTYNNFPFMILNLEFMANSSALAWMKALLAQNTGVNVIIATHSYLDANAGYSSSNPATTAWNNALKATLDTYPNVFLALCGHVHGWNMTRVWNRQEILFDFQEANNQTGAASVRIYTFNLANKQIYASTYCIDNKTWLLDPLNQFSFSASTVIPLATPALAASAFSSATVMTGLTWNFFAHASGGLGGYSFQWYEGTTLLTGQTSMLLPVTKATAGTYTYTCKVTDTQGTTATSNTITLTVINR